MDFIVEILELYGVMVVVEVEYMCMIMWGIKKFGVMIIIFVVWGVLEYDVSFRVEVLLLIKL